MFRKTKDKYSSNNGSRLLGSVQNFTFSGSKLGRDFGGYFAESQGLSATPVENRNSSFSNLKKIMEVASKKLYDQGTYKSSGPRSPSNQSRGGSKTKSIDKSTKRKLRRERSNASPIQSKSYINLQDGHTPINVQVSQPSTARKSPVRDFILNSEKLSQQTKSPTKNSHKNVFIESWPMSEPQGTLKFNGDSEYMSNQKFQNKKNNNQTDWTPIKSRSRSNSTIIQKIESTISKHTKKLELLKRNITN